MVSVCRTSSMAMPLARSSREVVFVCFMLYVWCVDVICSRCIICVLPELFVWFQSYLYVCVLCVGLLIVWFIVLRYVYCVVVLLCLCLQLVIVRCFRLRGLGGTQTGSYQTGLYQKGRFIPPKPKLSYVLFFLLGETSQHKATTGSPNFHGALGAHPNYSLWSSREVSRLQPERFSPKVVSDLVGTSQQRQTKYE